MREPKGSPGTHQEPPNPSTVLLLLTTMLDTTWRMFVPTLGLASLGLWADSSWTTGPLWSLIGVCTGIIIAALLVRQQFKNVSENT